MFLLCTHQRIYSKSEQWRKLQRNRILTLIPIILRLFIGLLCVLLGLVFFSRLTILGHRQFQAFIGGALRFGKAAGVLRRRVVCSCSELAWIWLLARLRGWGDIVWGWKTASQLTYQLNILVYLPSFVKISQGEMCLLGYKRNVKGENVEADHMVPRSDLMR